MLANDIKKSLITLSKEGIITTKIAAPMQGLNKKLIWKTLTCGAVFEIIPKIISCPNVASNTGDAICKPIYKTFEVILTKYGIFTIWSKGTNEL